MPDERQPAVYALYPGRRRDRIYEFVEEYAGPTALAQPIPNRSVQLVDERGERIRSVQARTVREAVELGLLNPEWALAVVVPTPTGVEAVVAYTADGNSVLGLRLVGEQVDDEPEAVLAGLERAMRSMMTAFPAELCLMGAELELHWTADAWAAAVRQVAADFEHDLPWYVRGEWFTKSTVRVPAGVGDEELDRLGRLFRAHGLQIRVEPSYPVRHRPGAPWTVLVETPLRQFLDTVDPRHDGSGLERLVADLARVHAAQAGAPVDADPVRGRLLAPARVRQDAEGGRLLLHDIATDTQWIVPTNAPKALLAAIDPADGRGRPLRPEPDGSKWVHDNG